MFPFMFAPADPMFPFIGPMAPGLMPFPYNIGPMAPMGAAAIPRGGMSFSNSQPTAEQMAEMQRAALQFQHQQLTQLREGVGQYGKSIEEALSRIEKELAKTATAADEKSAAAVATPSKQR